MQCALDLGPVSTAVRADARADPGDDVLAQFTALRPPGGFGLIMADPPWSFDNWSAAGEGRNAKAHYDCTPLDWIKGLPVAALAGEDCLLWLWATNPMLREGLAVLDAWGFAFRTAGHWVKQTRTGKLAFGTGYILRSAGEPFLIGVRGAPRTSRSVRSVVMGEARAHSQKPEAGYAAAEALMPDARRIEVFSRTNRPGWSVWGNEVGKLGAAP